MIVSSFLHWIVGDSRRQCAERKRKFEVATQNFDASSEHRQSVAREVSESAIASQAQITEVREARLNYVASVGSAQHEAVATAEGETLP